MKKGLLIVAGMAATWLGLSLTGWAIWFYCRGRGSYLAIPEIIGFVGIYVAYQGVDTVRRIIKKMPPGENPPTGRRVIQWVKMVLALSILLLAALFLLFIWVERDLQLSH